jgi:DNA-binding PadR family transcriptional regulator
MAKDFKYEQAIALAKLAWALESGDTPWLPTSHGLTIRALEKKGLLVRTGLAERGWADDTLPQRQLYDLTEEGQRAVEASPAVQELLKSLRERGTVS